MGVESGHVSFQSSPILFEVEVALVVEHAVEHEGRVAVSALDRAAVEEPRDHGVEAAALEGDLVGLDAAAAAPEVLAAVQQPVGVGRIAARLELPEPDEPPHASVDRLFEQMLKVAPKPGRDPLGDAGLQVGKPLTEPKAPDGANRSCSAMAAFGTPVPRR